MPAPLLEYIANVYNNAYTFIESARQRKIRIQSGILQGDPMSGTLFNWVLDMALQELDPKIGYDLANGVKVNHFASADDCVLLANTPQGLQALTDVLVQKLGIAGLHISPSKSASLRVGSDAKWHKWYVDPEPFL